MTSRRSASRIASESRMFRESLRAVRRASEGDLPRAGQVSRMDATTFDPLGGEIVWQPSETLVRRSRIARFLREHNLPNYDALYRRSIEDIGWFWDAAVREMAVEWYTPYTRVFDDRAGVPWTRWWIDGRCNLVHNCVDKHREAARGAKPALRWEGEDG
ncbi:MAG: hypothetical protein FJX78_09495, partial [Armatimonadetes bacterium]|nr:hypothetical protein [Armatimonadota bacterium]